MCAGCELITQQVTQQPTTITMILGYIFSGGLILLSYAIVFSKKCSSFAYKICIRCINIVKKIFQKNLLRL
jgi:hypothetical protein